MDKVAKIVKDFTRNQLQNVANKIIIEIKEFEAQRCDPLNVSGCTNTDTAAVSAVQCRVTVRPIVVLTWKQRVS